MIHSFENNDSFLKGTAGTGTPVRETRIKRWRKGKVVLGTISTSSILWRRGKRNRKEVGKSRGRTGRRKEGRRKRGRKRGMWK
jgi:hypothetical protein